MNLFWTPERLGELFKLRKQGNTFPAIAGLLGTSESSAKAAYQRHITGRNDNEAERSRQRAAQLAEWERANREKRNADKKR